jgi:hypothetical protein
MILFVTKNQQRTLDFENWFIIDDFGFLYEMSFCFKNLVLKVENEISFE